MGLANAGEAISMVDNLGLIHRLGNMTGLNVHFYYPELSANITVSEYETLNIFIVL